MDFEGNLKRIQESIAEAKRLGARYRLGETPRARLFLNDCVFQAMQAHPLPRYDALHAPLYCSSPSLDGRLSCFEHFWRYRLGTTQCAPLTGWTLVMFRAMLSNPLPHFLLQRLGRPAFTFWLYIAWSQRLNDDACRAWAC